MYEHRERGPAVGLETRSATMRREALYHSEPWYRAYMAALFESNAALIAPRIGLAERLIAARERERNEQPF